MKCEFTVKTRVVAGLGSLAVLPFELEKLGSRVAVIADRGVDQVGLLDVITADVSRKQLAGRFLIDPDPDVDAVEVAASRAREVEADVVLAVGGGSALGAAKAVSIRLTNSGSIDTYEGVGNTPSRAAPTVAVPTTAGSGSEVSRTLILHEPGRVEELVVRVPGSEPRVAILDGRVLRNLPSTPLIFAALDALCHCVESTWARRSTFFTEALAHRAAQTIIDTLPGAVDGAASGRNAAGENDRALQLLLEASCAANMACGNSGLALVHGLSTAPSVRIAHGLQNGILLPHVAAFNAAVTSPETRLIVEQIAPMYERIEFTPAFSADAVGPVEVDAMVAASTGHAFRTNNRAESTDEELVSILVSAGATAR